MNARSASVIALIVGLAVPVFSDRASAQAADSPAGGLMAGDATARLSQPWMRVQSPNFTVRGDLGEKRLNEVAQRLEQFREAVTAQLPQAVEALGAPIAVVAFTQARDYHRFDRKAFAALATDPRASARPVMAVSVEQKPRSDGGNWNLYFEYTRLVLSSAPKTLPLWLETGLTEFYATFKVSADGRTAQVGLPIDGYRLASLRSGRPIPLSELMAADRATGIGAGAGDKMTGRFSAQSWALVHYLQVGSPARAAQAKQFMHRLANGEDGAAAFNASFPDAAKLEAELFDYFNTLAYSYQELTLPQAKGGPAKYSSTRMTEPEVTAVRSCVK